MTRARRAGVLLLASGALATAAVLGMAAPASAEVINDLTTEVTVNPDTSFRVVETIEYDFEYDFRHGIFRDIPLYDVTEAGDRRVYGITVNSVTMDGAPVQVEESEEDPYLHLRIGDPDRTINGPHTYVIDYTVTDGLRVITAEDMADPLMPAGVSAGDVELYWDLVGSGWQVPITQAVATVTGPGPVLSAKCFTGSQGSTMTCPAAVQGSTAGYGPVSLWSQTPLTGATVFPAAAFARAPTENITAAPLGAGIGVLGGLLPAGLLVAVPVLLAVSKRREDRGVDLPASPAQYSPPDGLTAAEMATAYSGATQNAQLMVATLVDLAARRWINLSQVDGDLRVDWLGMGTDPIREWENNLVGAILRGQPHAVLSGYDKGLADLWSSTVLFLRGESEANGRRNPKGDAPDQRWNWLALVFVIAIALGILAAIIGFAFLAAVAITSGIGAMIGFIAARIITPRKETEQSAQFRAKVRGLEKVLGTDSAQSRREFAQRSGLAPAAVFATMLPYAIVLDLEDSWVGAFPDLTPEDLTNYGFYYVGIGAMSGFVSSGTSSISSAMTAPSSGSGGGGFSGGGGGGGGGGSW
ncbi:MAG: DUF2207 domain-containing protein [Actinomycetota bacterium]|nr:DUF2207 domain-containing protein [Actinomycetota bacterium]